MISTQIKLFDAMSPVLNNIVSSVDVLINSLEACEKSSENMIDADALNRAKDAINTAKYESSMYADVLRSVGSGAGDAGSSLDDLTKTVANNTSVIEKAKSSAETLLKTYLSFRGVQAVLNMADDFQNMKTRLETVAASYGKNSDYMLNAIRESAARSRGEFMMTADVVSKLGMQARKAFHTDDELVMFAEQLNKNFKIAGTNAQGVESVMYNLTQALASGVLRGQDLNAVMSNAPIILDKVAEYMGTDISQIRKLAEEGELSAEVIKNALISKAGETNAAFENMPLTFADIVTRIKNTIDAKLADVFVNWNEFLNSEDFQTTVDFICTAVSAGIDFIGGAMDVLIAILSPVLSLFNAAPGVITAVVAALIAYQVATSGAALAQRLLNAAMNANPIFLIISAVVMIIMLIAKWIQSVGGLTVAWLIFKKAMLDTFTLLYTVIGGFMLAVGSVVLAVVQGVLHGVQMLVNGGIDILNGLIKAANLIPGVNIALIGKATFADDFDKTAQKMRESVANQYTGTIENLSNQSASMQNEITAKQAEIKAKEAENKKPKLPDMPEVPNFDQMKNSAANIDANTKGGAAHAASIDDKLDEGVEVDSEDLKEIRDVMFQRAIQNLSWDKLEVHVDNSFGDIHETADADQVAKTIEEGLYEAINKVGVMT